MESWEPLQPLSANIQAARKFWLDRLSNTPPTAYLLNKDLRKEIERVRRYLLASLDNFEELLTIDGTFPDWADRNHDIN